MSVLNQPLDITHRHSRVGSGAETWSPDIDGIGPMVDGGNPDFRVAGRGQ